MGGRRRISGRGGITKNNANVTNAIPKKSMYQVAFKLVNGRVFKIRGGRFEGNSRERGGP